MQLELDKQGEIQDQLGGVMTASLAGSIVETLGMTATAADFPAPVGAQVSIAREAGASATGEVIGFRDGRTIVYLYTGTSGVRRGDQVRLERTSRTIRAGGGHRPRSEVGQTEDPAVEVRRAAEVAGDEGDVV